MIIQLQEGISVQEKAAIIARINSFKYKVTEVKTQFVNYLICIGKTEFDIRTIGQMPGIKDLHRVSDDFKLVSRKWKVKPSVVDLGDGLEIKQGNFALMAGPCSIEDETQIQKTI